MTTTDDEGQIDYYTIHECIMHYDYNAFIKLSKRIPATLDDMKAAMKLYIKTHMCGKAEQCELEALSAMIYSIIDTTYPQLKALTHLESDWMCHICYEYMRYLQNPDDVFIPTSSEQFDELDGPNDEFVDGLIINLRNYAKTQC